MAWLNTNLVLQFVAKSNVDLRLIDMNRIRVKRKGYAGKIDSKSFNKELELRNCVLKRPKKENICVPQIRKRKFSYFSMSKTLPRVMVISA